MLSARPSTLEAAAAALAPPKGDSSQESLRIDAQRDRLLAIPVAELARYRINARALEILPILAGEVHNQPLRDRVIALSIAQSEQLSWSQLARLLPWIYMIDDFRRLISRRAAADPPPSRAPRWLQSHWRAVLGRDAPATALATAGLEDEPVLARLLAHLQLPIGTPLAEAVLGSVIHSRDDEWLSAQPYTETLRFIESGGAAPAIRTLMLRRILTRYATRIRDPSQLSGAALELMLLARSQLLGWPRPHAGLWHGLPTSVLLVGRWCQRRDDLSHAFGEDDFRVTTWSRWLRYIERVEPAGAVVGVALGARVFAELAESPTVCRVYSPTAWADFVHRQAQADHLLPPPRPEVRLPASPEQRPEIDRFILERCGLGF